VQIGRHQRIWPTALALVLTAVPTADTPAEATSPAALSTEQPLRAKPSVTRIKIFVISSLNYVLSNTSFISAVAVFRAQSLL
jgi:hypothetical protein